MPGVEPQKGINALAIAADAIRVLKLGRIDRQTTEYSCGASSLGRHGCYGK